MDSEPSFEELVALEPRLAELEARARAVRDDGRSELFCSNHAWLPVNAELRNLVGVARQGGLRTRGGDPRLWSSQAYSLCYERLSRSLPACRACGCTRFEEQRVKELADGVGRARGAVASPRRAPKGP